MELWVLTFYFYSFLGWIWECCYVGIRERRVVNRGFIHGPFLPLYGSATVMMLLVGQNFSQNILLLYFASAMGATALEYVTGITMEALFKVRYWDYSDRPFNYKGQICLEATLLWGLFGVLFIRVIHPTVEHFLLVLAGMAQGNIMKTLVYLLTIYFVADCTLSFREAMELRDLLLALEHLQEAVEDKIESTKNAVEDRIESTKNAVEDRIESTKTAVEGRIESTKTAVEGRIESTKNIMTRHVEERREWIMDSLHSVRNQKLLRRFFLVYPTATSQRFAKTLEELKKKFHP